jgi:hypothetical protein
MDLGGLQMELESLLGCRVDVITARGLEARIRERVLREAVPLFAPSNSMLLLAVKDWLIVEMSCRGSITNSKNSATLMRCKGSR